jgi:hypothetical protein
MTKKRTTKKPAKKTGTKKHPRKANGQFKKK